MARFDVYRDPRGSQNLLLCVQSDMFDEFDTRMAIPLLPKRPRSEPVNKLNPVLFVDKLPYILFTQLMLAVPAGAMRQPVANLAGHRDEITAALDFLFQGF